MKNNQKVSRQYVIGQAYPVECVRWSNFPSLWTPIIGPLHDDTDIIELPFKHWHIDFRFISKRFWDAIVGSATSPGEVARRTVARIVDVRAVTAGPVVRRMVCKRLMPTFPATLVERNGDVTEISWMARLEVAYAGHRLKSDCSTCPHRGVPLAGIPPVDGVVVCPGHGLAWNVSTGELVRRTAMPSEGGAA